MSFKFIISLKLIGFEMIILLSPAKTLNYESSKNLSDFSSPVFLNKSKKLIDELKKKKPRDISSLMKISDKLTSLNVSRYKSWNAQKKPSENAKQSIYVFRFDFRPLSFLEHWLLIEPIPFLVVGRNNCPRLQL